MVALQFHKQNSVQKAFRKIQQTFLVPLLKQFTDTKINVTIKNALDWSLFRSSLV